jgi:hypothetical protein
MVAWALLTGGFLLGFLLVDPTKGDNYLGVVSFFSVISGTAIVVAVRFLIDYQRQAKQLSQRYLMWQDELFEKEYYQAALETMHEAKARDTLVIDRLWATIPEVAREQLRNEDDSVRTALMNVHNPLHSSIQYPRGWMSAPSKREDDAE